MSSWHREHPELVGTDADPWMIHDSYARMIHNYCSVCAIPTRHRVGNAFTCERCLRADEQDWTPED